MRRIEVGSRLVQGIDDYHGGADGAGALESTQQRIGKKYRTEALALLFLRDRQPSDEGATDERVSRDVFASCLGNLAL
jgi:hypothetical protein